MLPSSTNEYVSVWYCFALVCPTCLHCAYLSHFLPRLGCSYFTCCSTCFSRYLLLLPFSLAVPVTWNLVLLLCLVFCIFFFRLKVQRFDIAHSQCPAPGIARHSTVISRAGHRTPQYRNARTARRNTVIPGAGHCATQYHNTVSNTVIPGAGYYERAWVMRTPWW